MFTKVSTVKGGTSDATGKPAAWRMKIMSSVTYHHGIDVHGEQHIDPTWPVLMCTRQLEYVWLNVFSARLSWTTCAKTNSNKWLMCKYYKQRLTYKITRDIYSIKNNQIISDHLYLLLDPFRCHPYIHISPIYSASPSHSLQEVSLPRRPRWSHTHRLHRDPKWWSWPPSWIERPGAK